MRRLLLVSATLAGLLLAVSPAFALVMIANFSTTQKTVQSDAVVVGKVTEIEKEEVEVTPFAGAKDKIKMRVAVIKLSDSLAGAKNITHVKVLIPSAATEQPKDQPQALPGGPIGRPVIGRPIGRVGMPQITVKEGDEALYFLAKHPTNATYFVLPMGHNPIETKAEAFKGEVAKVKAVLATLADPMAALKAEKAEDRLGAVATLIQKYRRGLSPVKEEAIPAEETKAILKILADADWTVAEKPQAPGSTIDYQAQPVNLVGMLGLYPGGNGFPQVQPKPGESYAAKYHEAFKAWLAKDGEKFQIKKFVPKN